MSDDTEDTVPNPATGGLRFVGNDENDEPVYEIGQALSDAQRKENERKVYDEAQRTVIDPLNEDTEKPSDPGYISGDESSPGTMPKGE